MANCIKCKKELPEGALYCPACGKKQIAAPRKRRKRANGTGTVYKMGGKREKNPWAAQKSGVWIGSYPTREAATKALERLTDHEITDEYNLTFRQIYERWQPEDRLQRYGWIRSRIQTLQQPLRPAISQTANGRFPGYRCCAGRSRKVKIQL